MAIVFVFERHFFDLSAILTEAFSVVHLGMGLYFTLIGGFIGLLFVLFHYRTRKTNNMIILINDQLKNRNEELLKSIQSQSGESPAMGELWLTLNQVHKGVELLSNGSIGGVNQRQSALLEITQANIKELINIVEKSFNTARIKKID